MASALPNVFLKKSLILRTTLFSNSHLQPCQKIMVAIPTNVVIKENMLSRKNDLGSKVGFIITRSGGLFSEQCIELPVVPKESRKNVSLGFLSSLFTAKEKKKPHQQSDLQLLCRNLVYHQYS